MIGIINYNSGNIKSVANLLERLGEKYVISDDPIELAKMDRLIFPGQGRAGQAMRVLNKNGLDSFIKDTKQPFLGICLGMQILVDHSEEDDTTCLGIIPGRVKRFSSTKNLPIPQIGWNSVNGKYYYFVHSYFVDSLDEYVKASSFYTEKFASIIQKDNFWGVQFHPEKSGKTGQKLIGDFIKTGGIGLVKNTEPEPTDSQLATRVIACMDVKDGKVVKGTGYQDLKIAGDPVTLAKKYAEQGVDELMFLDIEATTQGRKTLYKLVQDVAKEINIPFSVGGGVRSIDDIRSLLKAGADKVSIGSAAIKDQSMVRSAVNEFGSQCIVISIDPKKKGDSWEQYVSGGKVASGVDAIKFARRMADIGVGELLVNSLDQDGTGEGYDLKLLQAIRNKVNIPIIASSGAGKLEHFYEAIKSGGADAVLAASLFHSGKLSVKEVKDYLSSYVILSRTKYDI